MLVFVDKDAANVDWYMQAHDFIQDTPLTAGTPAEFSCDFGRGRPDNSLFAMDHRLSQSFPSTASAARISCFDFIYQRVTDCHRQRQRKVNFVVANFQKIGDAGRVVDYLNGVASQRVRPGSK